MYTLVQLKKLFLFVLVSAACPIYGQTAYKNSIQNIKNEQWHSLKDMQIHASEKFFAYRKVFKSKDTLWVCNAFGDKLLSFSEGENFQLSSSSPYGVRTHKNKTLEAYHLDSTARRTHSWQEIDQSILTRSAPYLFLYQKKKKQFISYHFLDEHEEVTKRAQSFHWDIALEQGVLEMVNGESFYIYLKQGKLFRTLLPRIKGKIEKIIWPTHGKGMLVIAESKGRYNYHYNDPLQKKSWNTLNINNVDVNWEQLTPVPYLKPEVKNGKVFIPLKNKMAFKKTDPSIPEVWHAKDRVIYANRKAYEYQKEKGPLLIWTPENETKQLIKTSNYSELVWTPTGQYAIAYNQYPSYNTYDNIKGNNVLTLIDPKKNKKKEIIKISYRHLLWQLSPVSNFIAYIYEDDWYIYDMDQQNKINLSATLPYPVLHTKYDRSGSKPAYGIGGWTADGKHLVLYDAYDVWLVSTDGKEVERLTKGREKGLSYRIVNSKADFSPPRLFEGKILDIKKEWWLQVTEPSTKKSGFVWYKYGATTPNQELLWERKVNPIQYVNQSLFFLEEDFNLSPQLVSISKKGKTKKIWVKSNEHQKKHPLGISKLLSYPDKKGDTLQSTLFYPFNYNPKKKYPMVVCIYEDLSNELHTYFPLEQKALSFPNPFMLSLSGYFVLYPDISYQVNAPGESALEDVRLAMAEAVKQESIDTHRLALQGHSFGGYETAYIIGQTNIFATAIIGGAVTDLQSNYLDVIPQAEIPSYYWYEAGIFRFKGSLWEYPKAFHENNPITNAHKITTPLLSWAGKNDGMVNWRQSKSFYLALRRLEKEHTMLLYPNEQHLLLKEENQKDLFIRCIEWLGYYLKEEKKPTWLDVFY